MNMERENLPLLRTIKGRRFSVTGAVGYDFIDDTGETISVSSLVVPSPPVMIRGYGRQWKSDHDW